MANQVKYLSYEGLQVLVNNIKAGDVASLAAAKTYVGNIPADATQSDVISYLMAEIEKAKQAATFSGEAKDVTIEDANGHFNSDNVEGALAEAKKIADVNASDLATIKGEGEGSIKKALADAKAYTDGKTGELKIGETSYATVKEYVDAKDSALTNVHETDKAELKASIKNAQDAADAAQGDVDALETLVGTLPTGDNAPTTVVAYIKSVEDKVTGDAGQIAEDLAAEIERAKAAEKANADAIVAHKELVDGVVTTLVGDDANKSVRTIANEELAAQLIPENAKESLNTLQEIASWIQAHPDDASAMNQAISALQALVGTLPEGITATTVTGYIAELVQAEETRATGVEEGLNTRLETVEAAIGEGGGVSTQITNAINALDATVTNEVDGEAKPDVTVTVVEEDGKLKSVSAVVNAKYDAEGTGAAEAKKVQGETTSTIKDVEDKVDAITAIETAEITALFATETV